MKDLINNILSLLLGGGLIANVVMYFIKRRDERKESQRAKIDLIQDNLAEYKNIIFHGLMDWHVLFSKYTDICESYIGSLEKECSQLKVLKQSYEEYFNSHKDSFCKYAETCPHCEVSDVSEEKQKLNKDYLDIEREREQVNKTYINEFSKLFSTFSNQITPYGDFLARLKDVYKLDKQTLDALYPSLRSIDSTNIKLQYKLQKPYTYIEDCLSEFKEIGNLLTTLIGDIEKTQREINKQIN